MDEWIVWAIMLIIGGLLGLVVGLWRDPVARTKFMRRLDRKNHIILSILSKDGKSIRQIMANADRDLVKVGNSLYVIEEGRIFRKDKPETGFFISKEHIKWEEGVPTVYVYSDSMKPANFDAIDKTSITPDAAGATILAFIANELLKGLIAVQEYRMMLLICIILGVLNLGGQYIVYNEAHAAKQSADTAVLYDATIMDHFLIPIPNLNQTNSTNSTSNNGTLVIRG